MRDMRYDFLMAIFAISAQSVPLHERQSIRRAELRAALHVLHHKQPGVLRHIVTDSQLVFWGLTDKREKWQRHRWAGSRGTLSHTDF